MINTTTELPILPLERAVGVRVPLLDSPSGRCSLFDRNQCSSYKRIWALCIKKIYPDNPFHLKTLMLTVELLRDARVAVWAKLTPWQLHQTQLRTLGVFKHIINIKFSTYVFHRTQAWYKHCLLLSVTRSLFSLLLLRLYWCESSLWGWELNASWWSYLYTVGKLQYDSGILVRIFEAKF